MKKTVQLSNIQIEQALSGFKVLKDSKIKLDALTMYTILKTVKVVEGVYGDYEVIKNDLFKKYGLEEGGKLVVPKEKEPEFFKELLPVANAIVEIDINTIGISQLAGISLDLDAQIAIDFMIDDDLN